jgi:SEC-C motif
VKPLEGASLPFYPCGVASSLTDSRPEMERQVREYFGREVAGCAALLELAREIVEPEDWRGRGLDDSKLADRLIVMEAARSLKTYRGSLDAALGGFGPQAAMQNRSLFEGMAVAHWVRANPELAAERFQQHIQHNRGMWAKRFGTLVEDAGIHDLPTDEEQHQLDKIFGKWGTKLWAGLAMHEIVDAIESQWAEPRELRQFFAIAYADNVETQHTSALSLSRQVTTDDESNFILDSGPSLAQIPQALYGALWPFGHLLTLVAEHFAIEGRERIAPLVEQSKAIFFPIPESERPGRNDPCPCGSGKKYKKCHGS